MIRADVKSTAGSIAPSNGSLRFVFHEIHIAAVPSPTMERQRPIGRAQLLTSHVRRRQLGPVGCDIHRTTTGRRFRQHLVFHRSPGLVPFGLLPVRHDAGRPGRQTADESDSRSLFGQVHENFERCERHEFRPRHEHEAHSGRCPRFRSHRPRRGISPTADPKCSRTCIRASPTIRPCGQIPCARTTRGYSGPASPVANRADCANNRGSANRAKCRCPAASTAAPIGIASRTR